MAFPKFALVGEILLSLIRLRTVSSYETDSQETEGKSCACLPSVRKKGNGERYTDSSYTADSHANTGLHALYCKE